MTYPELPESLLLMEEDILRRWSDEDLFGRTLDRTAHGEEFVFYEGPPTANGRPGLHHVISRTIKDLVCRHRTMQGRHVTRIAGWDTHGLPVEIEAERKLGISGKLEIEELGIERFNEVCRDSVFTYKEEWERLSERIGYWLDYSRPYVTFSPEYVESVWWVLRELAERGLLYRGHKSVPYCPRCGTALSSHEVAQGYEEVTDPSLYFLCPLLDDDGSPDAEGRALLVWTTTPWTVPSNVALAVHPELSYAEVSVDGRRVVLAEALVEDVLGEDVEILHRYEADALVGRRYVRPLDLVPEPERVGNAWTVVAEDFVTADEGTGIVHVAPAFGADDYAAGQRHDLPLLNPVDDEGRFEDDVDSLAGLFVKDADASVLEELRERELLFRLESYVHSYPHCWRCESPLLYMARETWFAETTALKDRMIENNREVGWLPPEVGEGRFGEWLENNVDWALSRDRYWGTPLPVWVCDADPAHVEWVGAFEELADRVGGLPEGFDPHRPFIDELEWPCASCDGTMRRSPEVVDVWFDSGAMPYAQWHYPFEHEERWEAQFPADFICEGLDQTRGWFYSLMAISTMLDLGPAYRNVVVNGLLLDAEGQKMSKSKGNTVDPWEAISEHGADALRWYLITVSNPWSAKRYDPEGLKEAARKWFDTLFNTYRFFALYGNVEEWRPEDDDPPPEERALSDRWILSRLSGVTSRVGEELADFQLTQAYRAVGDFLDDDLSNWYVRRSRPRFWGKTDEADGRAAFRTLWEVLVAVTRLVAPVTPFSADWLHRALTGESAHLASFPTADVEARDPELEAEMETARALVTLGHAARQEVQIRVRQPLRSVEAVLPHGRKLRDEVVALVKEELNVKEVRFLTTSDSLTRLVARPNFRALGPRFQERTEEAAAAIRALSEEQLSRADEVPPTVEVGGERVSLDEEDFEIVEEAAGDRVVRTEGQHTVALDPTLDEELRREGLARELVNRVQRLRKDAGLEVTDRIHLRVAGEGRVLEAVEDHEAFVSGETLATRVDLDREAAPDGFGAAREVDLDGHPATIAIARDDG